MQVDQGMPSWYMENIDIVEKFGHLNRGKKKDIHALNPSQISQYHLHTTNEVFDLDSFYEGNLRGPS